MSGAPTIKTFFVEPTNTVSYLVVDPATGEAAVIDPVLDFDAASGEVDTRSAEAILAAAEAVGLRVSMILETHPHADHLSAGPSSRRGPERRSASASISARFRGSSAPSSPPRT